MKKRLSKSIHNIPITQEKLKLIEKVENQIKSNINNEDYLVNLFKSPDSMEVIKFILSKSFRNNIDIFILTEYIKRLNGLMSILKESNEESISIDLMLKKISNDLKCEMYHGGTFLMKVGDIGKTFYVTLTGSISILVPKTFQRIMSEAEYINHLKLLYTWEENFLFEKTFNENSKVSQIKLEEVKKIIINEKINGSIPMTIEEYISRINCDKYINNNISVKTIKIKIYGYIKVIDLGIGSTFGEIALINENCLRTATIYIKESSFFGTISKNSYRNSIRSIQERVKRENINFVFNILFSQISLPIFTQNYWNFFVKHHIKRGEYLFKLGEIRNELIFFKEGEIKIMIPNLTKRRMEELMKMLENNDNYHTISNLYFEDDNNKIVDVILKYAKSGDILGLNDLVMNNTYYCNAICESHEASYFSIDVGVFNSIIEGFNTVFQNLKKIEKNKKKLILLRLRNILKITKFSFLTKKKSNKIVKIKQDNKIRNKNLFISIQNSFVLETKQLNNNNNKKIKRRRGSQTYSSKLDLNLTNNKNSTKRNSIIIPKNIPSVLLLKKENVEIKNKTTNISNSSISSNDSINLNEKKKIINPSQNYNQNKNRKFKNKLMKRKLNNFGDSFSPSQTLTNSQNITLSNINNNQNKFKVKKKFKIIRRNSNLMTFYPSVPTNYDKNKDKDKVLSLKKNNVKANSFSNNLTIESKIIKKIIYYGEDPITNILIRENSEQLKKGILKYISLNSNHNYNRTINFFNKEKKKKKNNLKNLKLSFLSPKKTPFSVNFMKNHHNKFIKLFKNN